MTHLPGPAAARRSRVTHDLAVPVGMFTMIWAFLALCLLSAGSGLRAGLYGGRYQRGSLDEVVGVGISACTMILLVALGVSRRW